MNLISFQVIQCFGLILLLGITEKILALDNFQQRCVYYSESQNVCSGFYRDDINFYFNLSDQSQITKKKSWGWTSCNERITRKNQSVTPHFAWQIIDQGYNVKFSQQEKRISNWYGRLERIVLNVTLRKDVAYIKYKDYNCSIVGDGRVMHFGVGVPGQQPCEMHFQCQRIYQLRQE